MLKDKAAHKPELLAGAFSDAPMTVKSLARREPAANHLTPPDCEMFAKDGVLTPGHSMRLEPSPSRYSWRLRRSFCIATTQSHGAALTYLTRPIAAPS
jgi:hypothetical protein